MAIVNWSNVTDFGQLPIEANNVSNGAFWPGMFYMMWVILILMFIGYGAEIALVVSSFVMLVLGLLMVYGNLMAFSHLLTIIAILLFYFLYIIWSSQKVRT